MLGIAVCSDVIEELEETYHLLEKFRRQRPDLEVFPRKFHSTYDLLDTVENGLQFDIYILDTYMPNISGIEAGAILQQMNCTAAFIYLTASSNSVLTAAFTSNLIEKPFSETTFFTALTDAAESLSSERKKSLTLDNGGHFLTISYNKIIYIACQKRRIRIIDTDGSEVPSAISRKNFVQLITPLLEDERFLQISENHLINIQHVSSMTSKHFMMRNGDNLPLSSKYSHACQRYIDYVLGRRLSL